MYISRKKPQRYSRIARNQLGTTISNAFVLNEGNGPINDLITSQQYTLGTGLWGYDATRGYFLNGSNLYVNYALLNVPNVAPFSVTCVFKYLGNSGVPVGWQTIVGAGVDYYNAIFCATSTNNTIDIYAAGAAAVLTWQDGINFVDGNWLTVTVTFNSPNNTSIPVTLYVNGINYGTQISSATATYKPPIALSIGSLGNGDHPLGSPVSAVFYHNRALTQAQAVSMSLNPWQVFQTSKRSVLFKPASSPVNSITSFGGLIGNRPGLICGSR